MLKEQTNEFVSKSSTHFQTMSESTILQSFAIYFSSPSPKPIPYENAIRHNGPAILKYLFPYFNSNFNKDKLQAQMQFLIDKREQVLQQILDQKDFNAKKLILNRYLSIYSVSSNFNGNNMKNKIRFQPDLQAILIKNVISKLQSVKEDGILTELVNKIILLGYHALLLQYQNNYPRQFIIENFSTISKPYKILLHIILANNAELWKQFTKKQLNIQTMANSTSVLLNSQELIQSHAQTVVEFYYGKQTKKQIQQSIQSCLIAWWVKANDSLNTQKNCQFKTNLLGIIIEKHLSKQYLVDQGYTAYISQGIQKRMGKDGFIKKASIIIWYRFANKLGFQDTVKDYKSQATLFQIVLDVKSGQKLIQVGKQQKPCKQNSMIIQQNEHIQQEKQQRITQQQIDDADENSIVLIKPPRNIYDCILGLRNPSRRKVTIKYLPSIILKHSDDLTLCWLQLCQELIAPLYDQNAQALVVLFTLKPIQIVDVFSDRFFKADCSMSQRISLMQIIRQAIEQLSSNPKKYERNIEEEDKQFYFKKVTSRYFNENVKKEHQNSKQPKTRRWGHTRLQYERKNKTGQSLLIINNDPYINRLYQIANAVFFKLISKLPNSLVLLKNQEFVRCLLILFSAFIDNIKNHFQKYSIIAQIVGMCETLLSNYKQKQTKNIITVIQVLLKTSLVIDRFIPQNLLTSIIRCVQLLIQRKQYGINHFVQAIQENVYSSMKINTSLS